MNKGRHYLGVDIGGTKCAVLVGTDNGEVLAREEIDECQPVNSTNGTNKALWS